MKRTLQVSAICLMLSALVACAAGDARTTVAAAAPAEASLVDLGGGGRSAQPIVLFHMAGSNVRGEYAQIAPRLVEAGYHVLGVDLPAGGDRFGFTNDVASGSDEPDYCADYGPMSAAIAEVVGKTGKRPILVGSSYTAALVMKAAVERPGEVAGFLSLSPAPAAGLEVCAPSELLEDLRVPGIGVRPRNEVEFEIVLDQARAWHRFGVPTKIAEVRSHGASILDPERAGAAVEDFWPAVLAFLAEAEAGASHDG